MNKTIRIGTRDSQLALWQAHTVEKQLKNLGYKTEILAVKSTGDIILDKPLYELGITGIFTKTLDIAILSNRIDIAVHSMKDVPTALPQGIVQGAVLPRADVRDLLVHKGNLDFLESEGTIATGSLRRRAQWLHRYPQHKVEDLRGNINTRLQKLNANNWNGAIFATAGLERIDMKPDTFIDLDWMLPAPAQGAMIVVAHAEDTFCLDAVSELNHIETEICTAIERQFLRTLEGGCSAPVGALATYHESEDRIRLQGNLLSLDGTQKFEIDKTVDISDWKKLGFFAAKEVLENGGGTLMTELKEKLNK